MLANVMPISGRAGAAPALEPQEAYLPARSTALAGYAGALKTRVAAGNTEMETSATTAGTPTPRAVPSTSSTRPAETAPTGQGLGDSPSSSPASRWRGADPTPQTPTSCFRGRLRRSCLG